MASSATDAGTDIAISPHLRIRGEYQNIIYHHWNISTPFYSLSALSFWIIQQSSSLRPCPLLDQRATFLHF